MVENEGTTSSSDAGNGAGCLLVIGAVIMAICVGNIYTATHGWLVLGSALMLAGLFGMLGRR